MKHHSIQGRYLALLWPVRSAPRPTYNLYTCTIYLNTYMCGARSCSPD